MKNNTFKQFYRTIVVMVTMFMSVMSYGQCINSTAYLTYPALNTGNVETIGGCTYSVEYNTITNLVIGKNYIFTATISDGSNRYVTITDTSNSVIAHGISPLVVNAITVSSVRLHVTNDATCAGGSICHTTGVQFLADCPSPISLAANTITTSGANLTWNTVGSETAWDIQYGIQGFTLGTGTIITNVTASNYAVSGLNSGTNYQFYVRAKCSTEDSLWSTPASFATSCTLVTEFYENFDSTTAIYAGALPICWAKGGSASDVYIQNGTSVPMSAPNHLYMYGESDYSVETFAGMPLVSNLTANTHRLRFTAFSTSGTTSVIQVGYLTDSNDFATYEYLDEFLMPGTTYPTAAQFILVPGALPAGVQRLVFRNVTAPGEYASIYIDDVRWEPIPTCGEPSNVVVSSVLATTANVDWNAPTSAPANGYDYYVSTSNTAPNASTLATGSVAAGVTNTSLSSLTPVTTYYVWVRSVCSLTSSSSWSLAASFTTPCASYVPYYLENFSTYTYSVNPACWNRYSDGDPTTGPTGTNNSGSWNPQNMMNTPGNIAARMNIYGTYAKGWLVSPVFDLSAGGYQVKYDVGTTQYYQTGPITGGAMGSDDVVQLLMSVNGGTSWTPLVTYDATNTPGNTISTAVSNLTTTSNAVIFAYYGSAGTVSDGTDYDFFIDNFIVQTIPTVAPLCAANVVATPNATCGNFPTTISWDATSGSDGYKLSIGTTTGGTDVLNAFSLSALSYSFVGSLNTTYYFKLVPFNANGDATGCVEQSFITSANGCYCTAVPLSNDNSGITNVTLQTTPFATGDVTYFDHTATVVNVNQNMNTNVQISFATGYGYNTYIWIDLNDNYIFDTTELFYTGESLGTNPTTLNASFMMPASAAIGVHTMRIGTADYMPTPDPCYNDYYGVFLDFKVNVQPELGNNSFDSSSFSAIPNPVKDVLNVSYDKNINSISVFNLLGQMVLKATPNTNSYQLNFSELSSGTYLVKVVSDEATKTVKIVKN